MKKKSIKINAILSICKQICSLFFPLITIPYVSRVLQSANYGKINFGNSIVSYFSLLAGLGISSYAIREGAKIRDKQREFNNFAKEIFSITVISTLVSYILLFLLVLFSQKIKQYALLIAIQSVSIIITTLGFDWVNSVFEDYLYLTIRYLALQIVSIICLLLFVKSPEDYYIYAIITVISTIGGNLFNLFYIRKYVSIKLTRNLNVKKHFKPIIVLFFNAIASTIYVSSDTTILGYMSSEQMVGIYGLATKIYFSISQIFNSITLVSVARLSAYAGNGDVNSFKVLGTKIKKVIITLILPASVGLFMLSDNLILIIGGMEYSLGGTVLKILSITLFFAVMAGFYCCAVIIPFKQERICLVASSICAISNIALNFVVIPILGISGAAMTTLLSEAIAYFIYKYYSKKYVDFPVDGRFLFPIFIGCIAIIFVCLLSKIIFYSVYLMVLVSVIGSIVLYFAILALNGNEVLLAVVSSLKKIIKERL